MADGTGESFLAESQLVGTYSSARFRAEVGREEVSAPGVVIAMGPGMSIETALMRWQETAPSQLK